MVSGASVSCNSDTDLPTHVGRSGCTRNRPLRHRIVSSQTLTGESHKSFCVSDNVCATRLERRADCMELHSQMCVSKRYFILAKHPNHQGSQWARRCPQGSLQSRPCTPNACQSFSLAKGELLRPQASQSESPESVFGSCGPLPEYRDTWL